MPEGTPEEPKLVQLLEVLRVADFLVRKDPRISGDCRIDQAPGRIVATVFYVARDVVVDSCYRRIRSLRRCNAHSQNRRNYGYGKTRFASALTVLPRIVSFSERRLCRAFRPRK